MAGYKNKKNTNKVEEELIQNSGIKKKVSTPKESKKDSAELIWKSENNINVEKDSAEKLFKLLSNLEENEDVQSVSSNYEVSEEILKKLIA